jgi:hypothetical protein
MSVTLDFIRHQDSRQDTLSFSVELRGPKSTQMLAHLHARSFALSVLAARWQARLKMEVCDWSDANWFNANMRGAFTARENRDQSGWAKSVQAAFNDGSLTFDKFLTISHPSDFNASYTKKKRTLIILPSSTQQKNLNAFSIACGGSVLAERQEAILFTELSCTAESSLSDATGEKLIERILTSPHKLAAPWLKTLHSMWSLENKGRVPKGGALPELAYLTALDDTTSALVDSFQFLFHHPPTIGRMLEISWPGGDEDVALLQKWCAECRAAKKDHFRSEVLEMMSSLLKHYRDRDGARFTDNDIETLPLKLSRQSSRDPEKLMPLSKQITQLCARGRRPSEELAEIEGDQTAGRTWSLKVTKLSAIATEAKGHGDLLPTWTCALMEKPYGLKNTAEAEGQVPKGMVYQWALEAENDDYNNLIQNADDETAKKLSSTLIALVKKLNHKTEIPSLEKPAMKTNKKAKNIKGSESKPDDDFIFEVGDVVPDYYGRGKEEGELERILLHSQDNNFLIHAAVTKLGGIGKTQLARCFAHSVRTKHEAGDRKHPFQGGVVEINLRAHNYNPDSSKDGISTTSAELAPVAAMKEVLTLFRVTETLLDKLTTKEQLSEYYHSFFLHRNALLILDNAKDYEQVNELLPRPGSTTRAIVTARDDIKGLTPVTLRAWSLEEVEGYLSKEQNGRKPYVELTRWCKNDEQQRELLQRIYHLSHGLPLVLHMLSAFALATESAGKQTVVELLEARMAELSQGDQCTPAIAVGAMIDLCLHLLDEIKRRHLLALSIFRVHFDAAAATTLTGGNTVSLPDVMAELNLFSRLGLLMKEAVATIKHKERGEVELSGYRMHDLVRQAASERLVKLLDNAEVAELERRYVTHYLGAQAYQNELLLANPHTLSGELREVESTFDVGAVWFDREEQNYDVAFDLCSKKRMKDQKLRDELLSLSAGVGTRVCDLLMAVEKRIKRVIEGRDAAERLAEKATTKDAKYVCSRIVAMHTNSLGLAHRHKGNRPHARKLFTEALELSKGLKWDEGITIATGNRGNIHQEDASEAKTPDEKASYLKQALECHFAALEISERIHLQLSKGQDNGNAAIVLIDQWDLGKWKDDGLFEKARKHYAKRNGVAGLIGDERGLGNGEGNLASANLLKYLRSDPQDPETREEVLGGYMRAFKHHKKARNPRGMAACIGNLGRAELILACSGDAEVQKLMADAKIHFEDSLAIFVKVGDLLGQRTALVHRRAWFLANAQDAKAKADEKEIGKCESLAGVSALDLLAKGKEQYLPRHLADKYGKLSHIDLSDRAILSAYRASKAVATAKDVCAEYLKLQIVGSSKAETT